MTRLYLITGFLGAGKTTLLKKLAPRIGGRIAIIVNEFGRESIDEKLLADVNARLAGIAGGSIFCTCRLDMFESALIDALSGEPDAILVETSGLSDPTAIREVLKLRAEFSAIDYRGCLCLADARSLHKVYETARVVRKQLDAADLVLLTKCDAATPEEIRRARALIERHAPSGNIMEVSFGNLSGEQAERVAGMTPGAHRGFLTADVGLHSLTVRVDERASPGELVAFLRGLSDECYRVKGFARLSDGDYQVDCVGEDVALTPWRGACDNRLAILYAYGQQAKKAVEQAGLSWIDVVDAR